MVGISTIISGAGLALQAFSAVSAGQSNADQQEEIAEREKVRTAIEVKREKRERNRIVADQRVGYASAGLNPDAGSALDVLADDLDQAQLDIELIEAGGALNERLALDRARVARQQGLQVAAGALLGGFGQLYEETR